MFGRAEVYVRAKERWDTPRIALVCQGDTDSTDQPTTAHFKCFCAPFELLPLALYYMRPYTNN